MKWLTVQVGGQKWRIDLVKGNHRSLKEGESPLHGCTLYDECKIYIAREQSEQAREDTLLHELLHAAMYVSRSHHAIREFCPDEPSAARAEEKIVEGLVLILHPLLKDMGFKFPKGPNA